MQKWEYLTYQFCIGHKPEGYRINGELFERTFDHKALTDNLKFDQAMLNKLGEQGWELVSQTDGEVYYFKRPKS